MNQQASTSARARARCAACCGPAGGSRPASAHFQGLGRAAPPSFPQSLSAQKWVRQPQAVPPSQSRAPSIPRVTRGRHPPPPESWQSCSYESWWGGLPCCVLNRAALSAGQSSALTWCRVSSACSAVTELHPLPRPQPPSKTWRGQGGQAGGSGRDTAPLPRPCRCRARTRPPKRGGGREGAAGNRGRPNLPGPALAGWG